MQVSELISQFDAFCADLLDEGEKAFANRPETDVKRWVVRHIMQLHFVMQKEKDRLLKLSDVGKQELGFVIYSRINEYKERIGLRALVESESNLPDA